MIASLEMSQLRVYLRQRVSLSLTKRGRFIGNENLYREVIIRKYKL